MLMASMPTTSSRGRQRAFEGDNIMKLTLSSGSTPPGSYLAKFVGTEQAEANEYGAGIRWQFEIVSGTLAGTKIGRTTGDKPTLKNACGKMRTGISGKTAVG